MSGISENPVARFLICGGSAAAINWLARIALSQFMPFAAAVALAYGIGMIAGFCLYRYVVWRASQTSLARQAALFIAVNAYGAVVVLAVSLGLIELGKLVSSNLPVIETLAHGAAIAVGAITNYLGHSRVTFAGAQTLGASAGQDLLRRDVPLPALFARPNRRASRPERRRSRGSAPYPIRRVGETTPHWLV